MSLRQIINNDMKTAMKGGDQFTLDVLRFLNSAFGNKSIEKRGKGLSEELTDDEVLEILNREVKKRREAAELYKKGSRQDLAEKEEKEILIIQKYLPAQLPREEVEKIIDNILLTKLTTSHVVSFGEAMREVMKELRGKADSRLIGEIIKSKL